MELTEEQKQTLRNLYYSKGDVLQAAMVERLVARGVDEDEAVQAARICSNRIWRNSMASGAFTGVVLGALFTPVVGGVAGSGSSAAFGGSTSTTTRSGGGGAGGSGGGSGSGGA